MLPRSRPTHPSNPTLDSIPKPSLPSTSLSTFPPLLEPPANLPTSLPTRTPSSPTPTRLPPEELNAISNSNSSMEADDSTETERHLLPSAKVRRWMWVWVDNGEDVTQKASDPALVPVRKCLMRSEGYRSKLGLEETQTREDQASQAQVQPSRHSQPLELEALEAHMNYRRKGAVVFTCPVQYSSTLCNDVPIAIPTVFKDPDVANDVRTIMEDSIELQRKMQESSMVTCMVVELELEMD
ncbi:hypothetical protein C8R42DRAFT_639550 [Lentinula raphanica]|nr:hypothetical protein C8R42DRAFT_639550 [Lentinula raphanica]